MSQNRVVLSLLLAMAVGSIPSAQADPSIHFKVSLTGIFYTEQEQSAQPTGLATPIPLALLDARTVLQVQNLANRIDLRIDLRSRISGDFGFERKFTDQESAFFANATSQLSARGYLGGAEFFEVREASLGIRATERLSLQLGRMVIVEADGIKVDALRLQLQLGKSWSGSLFAGGYPNPYSRYVVTDYNPPCGNGVASGNKPVALDDKSLIPPSPSVVAVATDPCQPAGNQLALAAGLTGRYQYPSLSGSFAVVGSFFGGEGDGGPVNLNPAVANLVGNLADRISERDAPRIFVSWQNHFSPAQRLDLFSDLVVDLFGSAGAQLTRALLSGNLRLGQKDRASVRLSYAHMSSLAINMYLSRLLYNRFPNGTTVGSLGVVENNLTVLRTARDEARGNFDIRLAGKLQLGLEGRFRFRQLVGSDSNRDVYQSGQEATGYNANARNLSGDAGISLRDGGSFKQVRGLLSYTFLQNFRAQNHIVRVGGGRSWLDERLSFDLEYVLLATTDEGSKSSGCASNLNQQPTDGVATLNLANSLFLPDCFGRRSGISHEAGVTMTANPWGRLFLLFDYRFSALLTDPQGSVSIPTVLGHALLARIEAGF